MLAELERKVWTLERQVRDLVAERDAALRSLELRRTEHFQLLRQVARTRSALVRIQKWIEEEKPNRPRWLKKLVDEALEVFE